MAQYRDLNTPPQQTFAEIVSAMQDQAKSSKTGASGVKDLGESGDVVWPRPDGTPVSVRDVDLDLADARQRIEDAEGDLAGAQARIDTALDAEGHIREDEILRNATLLGDTVVEQINVTDKLVGTDGVFTGTVDFANVNVTGELLANEISGEHVYGTVVEGGEIRTTDGLAAQVTLSDTAFAPPFDGGGTPRPGIRIDSGSVTPVHKPGVGPVSAGGIAVYGGQNSSGQWGALTVRGSRTEILNDGGDGRTARIEVSTGAIDVRMESATGSSGARVTTNSSRLFAASSTIIADQYEARLSTSAGGTTRSLTIDDSGVWVKSGSKAVNLEGTTWTSLSLINGWSAYSGGGGYYNGLRAQRTPLGIRLDGMVAGGAPGSVIVVLPDDMQDVAAKQFTGTASGYNTAYLAIHRSVNHGNKYVVSYLSGPTAPSFVSVSTDAALL